MEPQHVKTLPEVMSEYNLSGSDYEIISELKHDKVWLIKDKKYGRRLVVKRLEQSRTVFPILLHQKLYESGLLVPPVLLTKNGEAYVRKNDRYYYVNEFVQSLERITIERRIEALAAFHKTARFKELRGIDESLEGIKLEDFMKDYTLKIKDIIHWGDRVNDPALKAELVEMTRMGLKVFHHIQNIDVENYLQKMEGRHMICHADFNTNNAFLTRKGNVLVMDFDFAHFGPPIEDFRFLMMSFMRKENQNMEKLLASLFTIYFKFLEEDKSYMELYLLDSMFPHDFHKQLTSMLKNGDIGVLEKNKKSIIYWAGREKEKYRFLLKGVLK